VSIKNNTCINVILFPLAGGGAAPVALEQFALAFGQSMSAQSLKELQEQRDKIQDSLFRGAKRPSPSELQAYGAKIADLVLSGRIGSLYSSLVKNTIRVSLIAEDNALKRVPWEYLVWPDVNQGPHARRTVARVVPLFGGEDHVPRRLSGTSLRVLLVAADISDRDPIPWEDTQATLERIFDERLRTNSIEKQTQIDLIEGATAVAVRRALKRTSYDIIHFIGHGRPDGIYLKGPTGKGEVFPTQAFATLMSEAKPALVILSACDTANVGNVETLPTIAETVVSAGIPAVVANQMPIPVSAIADFTSALYRSLLKEGDIDIAVNSGRLDLVQTFAGWEHASLEWGVPVLYRRLGCSQLFLSDGQTP
jgi:hypothetical protein